MLFLLLFGFYSEKQQVFASLKKTAPSSLDKVLLNGSSHENRTVSLLSGSALCCCSGQAYNWAQANKSDLMVLRDHLQHTSEG